MNYQERILGRVDALISQQLKLEPLRDLFHEYLIVSLFNFGTFIN